jgi:hypothetical protein
MYFWGPELFWMTAAAFGIAASAINLSNAPSREAIDRALERSSKPRFTVGLLTACKRGDDEDWGAYSLIAPERLLCYGPRYLTAFRGRASAARTSFGDTALQRYLRPVLVWNDIAFAILTGLFAALANLGFSVRAADPTTQKIFICLAVAGLAYGVVDVIEDVVLFKLLKGLSTISSGQAAIAITLTRLKMLTLAVSLFGLALFAALIVVRLVYNRFSR